MHNSNTSEKVGMENDQLIVVHSEHPSNIQEAKENKLHKYITFSMCTHCNLEITNDYVDMDIWVASHTSSNRIHN